MLVHRSILLLFVSVLLANTAFSQALFVKPVKVLGDPNFIGTASNPTQFATIGPNVVEGRELNSPQGVALDTSVSPPILYIADTGNNRVLAYQYATQNTAGAPLADLVLGQQNRFNNIQQGPGTTFSTGLRFPTGLAVDASGNLYVADTGNNRVVRYPRPFSQLAGSQFPDLIVGQTSFAGGSANQGGASVNASTLSLFPGGFIGRTGLAIDSKGNLWVTDTGNNRVLEFPGSSLKAGSNAPSATLAVGQPDLVSSAPGTSPLSGLGLVHPAGLSFDSSGNLFVADAGARVLVYPPNPGPNATASRILGIVTQTQPPQPAVNQTGLASANSVSAAGNNVIVSDGANNRVMVFPAFSQWAPQSTQFSPSATAVLGQTSFTTGLANQGNGSPSATTLSSPIDLATSGSELYVVDNGNNRVLVFPSGPAGPSQTATRVIGQLDFPYSAANLIEGKEFSTSGATAGTASGSAVLDQSVSPPRLYVADTQNNRVLGFANFTALQNGAKADLVIGQPDLLHNVINYPTGSATQPNAQGLNGPTGLVVDSAGNLYVADTFNSRILRFPAPFSSGNAGLQTADLVLGQSSFTSIVTDPTERTMNTPIGLAFTADGYNASVTNSGFLLASDANQNRVLFFPKPFSTGMAATKVLGQLTFSTTDTSHDVQRMNSPRGIAVDPQDRPIVVDFGNARVQIFSSVANLPNYATPSVTLTSGLSQPLAVGMTTSGQFWVADPAQNKISHFPSIDQLAVQGYVSDTSIPAVSPRSVAADSYNNLVVADGINRVLYFAPALAMVNAANYLTGRPLAPGAFAAIFPAAPTSSSSTAPQSVIAAGTDSATTFPLPTTLADTQVFVNGTPSALFFVSPGQINLPLSLNLPTGGTVDVQVTRASTGQVYGGGELQLAPASPGLFVIGGGQTGQVAALNQDGTVNSATNPVIRGQVIQLFGTGQGPVPGAPPDGQPGTGPLPTPANPQILLGSSYVPVANIQYSGLAPALVGVWQINFQVPVSAQSGNAVPITIFMNSIPSNNPSQANQIATTIAVK